MITTRKRPTHIRIKKDNPYYPMSYNGYIAPARLVMAEHLDRCLGSDEYIYFQDGNEFNVSLDNMMLVSHKVLNKLNDIRRIGKQIIKLTACKITLEEQLEDIQFRGTPCNCPHCTRSREARVAGYSL